jgi:hypothetical protein
LRGCGTAPSPPALSQKEREEAYFARTRRISRVNSASSSACSRSESASTNSIELKLSPGNKFRRPAGDEGLSREIFDRRGLGQANWSTASSNSISPMTWLDKWTLAIQAVKGKLGRRSSVDFSVPRYSSFRQLFRALDSRRRSAGNRIARFRSPRFR